jgi:PAS domain S-box-containing protein
VRGLVLHGRDVTERYEQQRRFRTLFQASRVPQALVYADGRGQLVNRAFCELFGRDASDLTQRSLLELVHADDHAAVHAEYDELLSGGAEHVDGDRRYIKADGELFFGRSNVSVVRDLNGELEYFLITIDDVTTQLEQAKKIVTSEARWRSLVEHSPDIVCILYPNGRWNANEAAVQLLGYPKGYDKATSIFELVHPDDIEAAATALEEVKAGTRTTNQPLELRFRDIHGKYWDLECIGQNLGDDPDVGGVIVTARNVTERKVMERALHAARQQFCTRRANSSRPCSSTRPCASRSSTSTASSSTSTSRRANCWAGRARNSSVRRRARPCTRTTSTSSSRRRRASSAVPT